MKKQEILIIASLFLILGCAGTSTVSPENVFDTYGIKILNFTTSQTVLFPGESTEVRVIVKNVGDFNTQNVRAILYNYGSLNKDEINREQVDYLLKGASDYFFWNLRTPTSQTIQESTYAINAKVYYTYNSTSFKQVAFVPETYTGEPPNVSYGYSKSDILINITTLNPIRISGDSRDFILRVELKNIGDGDVNYLDETSSEIKTNPEKSYFINNLEITVPSSWEILTSTTAEDKKGNTHNIWDVESGDEITTYKLSYDHLADHYETFNCIEADEESQYYDVCLALSTARRRLLLTRGKETTILLEFRREVPSEDPDYLVTESVSVNADYGYAIDTQDTAQSIFVTIKKQ